MSKFNKVSFFNLTKSDKFLYISLIKELTNEKKKNLSFNYNLLNLNLNIKLYSYIILNNGKLNRSFIKKNSFIRFLKKKDYFMFFNIYSFNYFNQIYYINNNNVFYKSLYFIKNKGYYNLNNISYLKYKNSFFLKQPFYRLKKKLNAFFFSYNINSFFCNYNLLLLSNYINFYIKRHTYSDYINYSNYESIIKEPFFFTNSIFKNTSSYLYNYKLLYNNIYPENYYINENKKSKQIHIFLRNKKNKFIWLNTFIRLKRKNLVFKDTFKEYNLRFFFNKVNIYYFFKFFKKKIISHTFSNLFNILYKVKKKRLFLKKKLISFFKSKYINTIIYRNTTKNLFLTLIDNKGNVLFSTSSGCIGFFGRKKIYFFTIYNLTKKFLNKIKTFIVNRKTLFKIIVKGSLLYVRNFFSCIEHHFTRAEFNLVKFIKISFFFKKYIFFIKNTLLKKKKNFVIDFIKYIELVTFFGLVFDYFLFFKHDYLISMRILFVQLYRFKPFIK